MHETNTALCAVKICFVVSCYIYCEIW